MKVTRSYWLGLGSGLILSALLSLSFSLQQRIPDDQSAVNQQAVIPKEQQTKQPEDSPLQQASTSTPVEKRPSEPQKALIERDFVIPKGANAEQIADLLLEQAFIKDKASFLERSHQMGADRQFRVGTFSLALGLTEEELINRLLK